jgi:hypothetical protein
MPKKKRIAVVYDTPFLVGKGRSVKKFIMAQRIFSVARPGIVASLSAKLTGKVSDQKVYHKPDDLFVVEEVIPSEVIAEVEQHPDKEAGRKLIGELIADQAVKVDMMMDTVAGRVVGGKAIEPKFDPSEVDKMLVRYAGRVVEPNTAERYELVLIATTDKKIAQGLAGAANALVVLPDDLTATSALRGRLAELVNADRLDKVTIEDGA